MPFVQKENVVIEWYYALPKDLTLVKNLIYILQHLSTNTEANLFTNFAHILQVFILNLKLVDISNFVNNATMTLL